MAIAHLHAGIVQRSGGKSAVGAAAYAARVRMIDLRTGEIHDYSRQASDVVWQGVFLPKGVDAKFRDLAAFANALEAAEKRKDAQTARTIELAIPHELTPEQRQWLVQDYGRENFTRKGLGFHVAIHRPHAHGDQRNHHAHFTISTRRMDNTGLTTKDRESDEKKALQAWRDNWEKLANRHLERHGHEARISMKTLEAQGIDRMPQIHLGQGASALIRKGIETDRGSQWQEIANDNAGRAIGEELAAEPEYYDRDQQDAAWMEQLEQEAIAHDEEQEHAARAERESSWKQKKLAWKLAALDRFAARLGTVRRDQQNRHLKEKGEVQAKATREREQLEQNLERHYGEQSARLNTQLKARTPRSLFPRLWAVVTGKEKAETEQMEAARASLKNLEARQEEQRGALERQQRSREHDMAKRHWEEARGLEERQEADARTYARELQRLTERYKTEMEALQSEELRRLEAFQGGDLHGKDRDATRATEHNEARQERDAKRDRGGPGLEL